MKLSRFDVLDMRLPFYLFKFEHFIFHRKNFLCASDFLRVCPCLCVSLSTRTFPSLRLSNRYNFHFTRMLVAAGNLSPKHFYYCMTILHHGFNFTMQDGGGMTDETCESKIYVGNIDQRVPE